MEQGGHAKARGPLRPCAVCIGAIAPRRSSHETDGTSSRTPAIVDKRTRGLLLVNSRLASTALLCCSDCLLFGFGGFLPLTFAQQRRKRRLHQHPIDIPAGPLSSGHILRPLQECSQRPEGGGPACDLLLNPARQNRTKINWPPPRAPTWSEFLAAKSTLAPWTRHPPWTGRVISFRHKTKTLSTTSPTCCRPDIRFSYPP